MYHLLGNVMDDNRIYPSSDSSTVRSSKNLSSNTISSKDFDIFWQWLTYSRGSSTSIEGTTTESSNVIRVFRALDMFDSYLMDLCLDSSCRHHNTISYLNLKEDLSMLPQVQFQKIHGFMLAMSANEEVGRQEAKQQDQQCLSLSKIQAANTEKKLTAPVPNKTTIRKVFGLAQKYLCVAMGLTKIRNAKVEISPTFSSDDDNMTLVLQKDDDDDCVLFSE
jgi:hypothetical protein